MTDRGLLSRPSPAYPEGRPLNERQWQKILRRTYYMGYIVHDGQQYAGRHMPLVSHGLFDRVQDILETRSSRGSRERIHNHYLRGIIFCDRCHANGHESRLIYTEANNGRGKGTYSYFMCTGRQNFGCDLPYLPVGQVEERIIDHYNRLTAPHGFADAVTKETEQQVHDEMRSATALHASIEKKLKQLDEREERLLDVLADGTLPTGKIRSRLNQLSMERDRLISEKRDTDQQLAIGAEALKAALAMLLAPHQTYLESSDKVRRTFNEAFFEKLYLNEHGFVTDTKLQKPFQQIVDAYPAYREAAAAPQAHRSVSNKKNPDQTVEALAAAPAGSEEDEPSFSLQSLFRVRVRIRTLWCSRWDSNPHWGGFKPPASADWATGACRQRSGAEPISAATAPRRAQARDRSADARPGGARAARPGSASTPTDRPHVG